ncbi:carbonic anhydrase 1-like [Physella acuta]|uniref:carbonic anhydrase 1-like n=1 Tax=Physella acuta TaxID=109671 RepID=UPI0027DD9E49|nr:carbonic anhydrase 1-like [Physella acuta]
MPSLLNGVSFAVVIPLLLFRVGEIRAMAENPGNWRLRYPHCGGVKQSPINILTNTVLYDPLLPHFDLSQYNRTEDVCMQFLNKDGRTVQVRYKGHSIFIKEGGLPTSYKLDQFHFHWGADDDRGSENSLDNITFPMEVHIVHRQHSLNSFRNAASYPSGLAVIGVFFKVVAEDNEKLNRHLLQYFSKVNQSGQATLIPTFALSEILPDINNLDYYRFDGSLTTPPCYESVIWSVATEFIPISESQVSMWVRKVKVAVWVLRCTFYNVVF